MMRISAKNKSQLENKLLALLIETPNGCWEWDGNTNGNGYGRIQYLGTKYYVHRISAHLYLGLDLEDTKTKICHKCDNRLCFNPNHLYLGSDSTNAKDRENTHGNMCRKGLHQMTPENRGGEGDKTFCKKCHYMYQQNYYDKTHGYNKCQE